MKQAVDILDILIHKCNVNNENDDDDIKVEIADIKYMKKVWSKYESIPNTSHTKTVEYMKEKGHLNDDIVYCASEKVHGANFSLITNGINILAGSRTQILDENVKFFGGWRDIVKKEKNRVLIAFELLKKKYKNKIKVVIIYGEIFGGIYQHKNEKYQSKNVKCIQKGVYYSPNIHFYAFDIKTDIELIEYEKEKKNKKTNNEYEDDIEIDGRLSVNESNEIFKLCGFLYAKILKKGTFNELLKFDVNNLQSTIPNMLNLPPPTYKGSDKLIVNTAEGIVIRKLYSKDHLLFKLKATKFLEIENAQKTKGKKKKTNKNNKNDINLETKLETMKNKLLKNTNNEFINFIQRCINNQRLQSCESKIGTMDLENYKKIQGLMMKDVFK